MAKRWRSRDHGSRVHSELDWKRVRDAVDLADITTRLLGPPVKREGRRVIWRCPFHPDHNPSFEVDTSKNRWKCWPCNLGGDAAALVMKLNGLKFPDAVAYLTGGAASSQGSKRQVNPPVRPALKSSASIAPMRLTADVAAALVAEAEARLWTHEGAIGQSFLTRRCLTPETARGARLGWIVEPDSVPWRPMGVVIPWFSDCRVARIKIRSYDWWRARFPNDKRPPKYIEAYRDPAFISLYPNNKAVRVGRPLVIVEGEFDALLLTQELCDLAAVVTLGSASARPTPVVLARMLAAAPWFVATDNDPAGDKAFENWPASVRRVRPPGHFKDWTEAKAGGVNLHRFWMEIFAGTDQPSMYTWEDLSGWRWGPTDGDPAPGIIIDPPDRGRQIAALSAIATDPEERKAIQDADDDKALRGLLERLGERGIRLDGALVHPTIAVRTITGRVTYTDPACQTFPKADRLLRIAPVIAGRAFVRSDYGQIEPRILLEILRRRSLISWTAGEDLYRDLVCDTAVDRDVAKKVVNTIINGGRPEPGTTGKLAEFISATEVYRASLGAEARDRGYVETLSGRRILLEADERNYGGKAVNRVVQGTAADIFNRAAVMIEKAITVQGVSAAVAFLLYDEIWVEADRPHDMVISLVSAEMEAAALADGVLVPVRFEDCPI